jgi:RNA polymerase-binding transcription factor DksA
MKPHVSEGPGHSDLHRVLLARRAELRQQLVRLAADQRRVSEPLSADFAEQVTQRENDEVIDALREGAHGELRAVEHAIERFESGTYGRCTRCGGSIETERLQAVPHATRCSHCAETQPL